MSPHDLPISLRPGHEPIEQRVMAELNADFYSLDELRLIVRVLEKYITVVELLDRPVAGGLQ